MFVIIMYVRYDDNIIGVVCDVGGNVLVETQANKYLICCHDCLTYIQHRHEIKQKIYRSQVVVRLCFTWKRINYDKFTVKLNCLLSLYLDESINVQGNTSMRSREFPKAQPEETPKTEC